MLQQYTLSTWPDVNDQKGELSTVYKMLISQKTSKIPASDLSYKQ